MDDPAVHPTVIDARNAARLVRQETLKARELALGERKNADPTSHTPNNRGMNHNTGVREIQFMGPEPRDMVSRVVKRGLIL